MDGAALNGIVAAAGAHGDPVAPVVLTLALILLAAKLGGDLAARVGSLRFSASWCSAFYSGI